MAYADTRANILGGGLTSVKIKAIGDAGYYSIPFFLDGTIKADPIVVGGSGHPRGFEFGMAHLVTITCRTMATHMTNLIKVIDTLCGVDLQVKATAINGTLFSSESISATTGYMGHEVQIMSSGDFSNERYAQFTFTRACTPADYQLAIASAFSDGSPTGGDAISALGSLVRADINPATMIRFQFREASSGTWDDTLTNIRNGSFTARTIGQPDPLRRIRPHSIAYEWSVEGKQASSTEVALVDNYNFRENDVQITFPDCYFTMNDKTGFSEGWTVPASLSEEAFLSFKGSGMVKPSEWDAMWTSGAPA